MIEESDNYGTEQEHFNQVFGARLRITAVRAAEGPGIECLEDMSPNDLVHWHTRLVTEHLPALNDANPFFFI